jgi:hypothetical protein
VFGAHREDPERSGADVNFLVIQDEVADRYDEMARLGQALGSLLIPADVVVVSREEANSHASATGTLIHHALSEGQVVGES